MVLLKLDWKVQTPRLHFSVSHLHVIGAQELPQELRDICISASTPPPVWYFRFTVKINSLGILGGALCLALALRRAQTQHTEGHPYGLVCPGFCLGSPRAAGAAEGKALCVLGITAAALSLSPFWLHFPLEQFFPCLLCPDSTVLFTFLFPLVAYGIYKSHFSSLEVLRNHAEMKSSFVF